MNGSPTARTARMPAVPVVPGAYGTTPAAPCAGRSRRPAHTVPGVPERTPHGSESARAPGTPSSGRPLSQASPGRPGPRHERCRHAPRRPGQAVPGMPPLPGASGARRARAGPLAVRGASPRTALSCPGARWPSCGRTRRLLGQPPAVAPWRLLNFSPSTSGRSRVAADDAVRAGHARPSRPADSEMISRLPDGAACLTAPLA